MFPAPKYFYEVNIYGANSQKKEEHIKETTLQQLVWPDSENVRRFKLFFKKNEFSAKLEVILIRWSKAQQQWRRSYVMLIVFVVKVGCTPACLEK